MSKNYNQQLLQAASLTAKTELLKKSLKNSNKVLMKQIPVQKSDSESDSESIIPSSQFMPMAFSTQQVTRNDSESDEGEVSTNFNSRTVESSNSDSSTSKKSTINIIRNDLINKPRSTKVSSESESDEDKVQKKVRNKEEIRRMLSLKNSSKVSNESGKRSVLISEDESGSSSSYDTPSKNKINYTKEFKPPKLDIVDSSSSSENEEIRVCNITTIKTLNNSQNKETSKNLNRSRHNDVSSTESDNDNEKRRNISQINNKDAIEPIEKLQKFLAENPDCKKVEIPEKSDISSIESDDEVYLLQVPKTVDPKVMQDATISLSKKSKLRTEFGKYVIKKQSDTPECMLVFSNTLRKINPIATFKMEKYVKDEEQSEIVVEEKQKQELPENIKVRHPLFGPEYKSKIELEEQIKEKLQQALQRFDVKEKPKRKKKIKVELEEDKSMLINEILEERFNTVKNNTIQERKNKDSRSIDAVDGNSSELKGKKKRKDETGVKQEVIENGFNDTVIEKKKKKKRDETQIKQEIQTEYETQDESEPKKKKKKRDRIPVKQEIQTQDESEPETQTSKKKKKKNLDSTPVKQEIQTEIETQDESELETSRKKKKKKNKNETNSIIYNVKMEIESQDEGESNVPDISFNQKPLKVKKHRKSILNSTEIVGNTHITDINFDVSKIEKEEPIGKKGNRKNENNDLINSLLSNVRSRLDSGSEQKSHKKKKHI